MRAAVILALSGFIVYGSLFPFDFVVPLSIARALERAIGDGRLFTNLGDVLGNVALFMPLGLAAALRPGAEAPVGKIVLGAIWAALLAVGVQFGQIFVASREALLADAVWNLVGFGVGVVVADAFGRGIAAGAKRGLGPEAAFAIAVVATWLAAELAPFVPVLAVGTLADNLRPLVSGDLTASSILVHASGVLLAAVLFERILGTHARTALIATILLVVAGRAIVLRSVLDVSCLAGLAAGYWASTVRRPGRRTLSPALALLALWLAITLRALEPFAVADAMNTWHWLPFSGWQQAGVVRGVQELLVSVFLYTGVLALAVLGGGHVLGSTLALLLWTLLLEIAQLWISGQRVDTTELTIVLGIGLVLRALRRHLREAMRQAAWRPTAAKPGPLPSDPPPSTASWRALVGPGLAWAATAAAIAIVLRLPAMPYNVRELFLHDGSLASVAVFALGLLWIGAGAGLMADRVAKSRVPLLTWGLWTMLTGVVSLLLLIASVTGESIGDIAGSTHLYYFVTQKDLWGTWWREAFLFIGSQDVVAFFERPVRYAALLAPAVIFLASFRMMARAHAGEIAPGRVAWVIACALPWLWLSKAIAFDWASTDNLNELIARDGRWGLGGGGYLYGLVALVAATAVSLARPAARHVDRAGALLLSALVLPVGWALLNMGLEANVEKYGSTFPAVRFLLGPDRTTDIPMHVLFLRWCAVQWLLTMLAAQGLIAWNAIAASRGARASRPLRDEASGREAPRGARMEPSVIGDSPPVS